jgi:hypothetical protein
MTKTKRLILAVLLTAAGALAQNPPQNWIGAGATWNQDASPQFAGWGSFAKCVYHDSTAEAPCRVYSITTWDVTFVPSEVPATDVAPAHTQWKAQYSQRTGGAIVLYQPRPYLTLLALGDAGAAQTADALGGAYSAGAGAVYTHASGATLEFFWRNLKTTATNNPKDFRLGLGWRF